MNEEVITKNFAAINQFMKEVRTENANLHELITGFQGVVATQQGEIAQLGQQIGIMQARLMGGGPTSGNNG